MNQPQCKLCRRSNRKLFLKGERCFSAKCSFAKKPYAPGQHAKPGVAMTEYGKQLKEKQTLKKVYGLKEKQFKKYFQNLSTKGGNFGDLLIGQLETRLDSLVYGLGLADSRMGARQLVTHGFFRINGKKNNIPSSIVKKDDEISFNPSRLKKEYVVLLKDKLANKKLNIPAWLELNVKELKGRLLQVPKEGEVKPAAKSQVIVEFYSR